MTSTGQRPLLMISTTIDPTLLAFSYLVPIPRRADVAAGAEKISNRDQYQRAGKHSMDKPLTRWIEDQMKVAGICMTFLMLSSLVTSKSRTRRPMIRYPKDSQFWATDFFVRGCKNFLESCPKEYKYQIICARNYNGDFKFFPNYCEMQYENCNTWQNWHVFKRERC